MARAKKIIFEEHFSAPGFAEYSLGFTRHMTPAAARALAHRLEHFDEVMLPAMDEAGIAYAVMSQTMPGVQGEPDADLAIRRARASNDHLASMIAAHPTRFGGFATLPMHDARTAAAELERCVRDLGFKGALVNGHTGGVYCDDPRYDALWEVVQALDVPFYLHPVGFHVVPHVFGGHPELEGAAWGWGVDTGTHALRMLFAGIFDRFPELKIVLGHMGEALPFLRWRFDSRFAVYTHGVQLERKPSDYFGRNILITTTGVCSDAALAGAIGEMGADAVMFSVDYPYESIAVAADWIDAAPLDAATKAKICHDNAARLLKLPT